MAEISIIDALNDRDLFANLGFDKPSWRPWLAFLRALGALPMDEDDLALYRKHTGRTAPPTVAFREACLVVGRRGGKSRVLAVLGVFLGAVLDWSEHTAPGEQPVVAILAADRRQARVILGYVVGILRAVPALAELIEDELTESVSLTTGVLIEITTASIAAPRGRTYAAVLADETAFWSTDAGGANPDKEIIAAVRPGLASLPGSMLLIASSPYARRGVLFDTFSRYYAKDGAPVLVWKASTAEMNSRIDPRIISEAYEADAESADAEYGGNFRTDITAFIGRDAIEAVVAEGVLELPPAAGLVYDAFCDPSGGSADSMTLAIGHMGSDGIAVLDAIRERKPPFSPEDVTSEFATLLRSYGISRVSGDAYAGEWPRERFAVHGVAYELSGRNKSTIYGDFLPALNGRRIRLLAQSRLIAQLCNLERRTTRGGRDSIDHGPGQHDDVCNSVCGVLTSIINDRRPALIRQSDMLLDDKGVAMPHWASFIFATLVIGDDGQTAITYFARNPLAGLADIAPLTLIDFAVGPLSGATVASMFRRLAELHQAIPKATATFAFVPDAYLQHVHLEGHLAEVIPDDLFGDLPALAIAAAGHVAAGRLKIAIPAMEKSATVPLAGALNFRAGEVIDADPLRLALLAGIALALNTDELPAAAAA